MIKENLTIIIKTFERKQPLINLLKSINNSHLKRCQIIIADDSKISSKKNIMDKFLNLNIQYLELEFDSGLSKGRNVALEKVKTKYFLLLDDDFLIDYNVDYLEVIKKIEKLDVDILSGYIKNKSVIDHTNHFTLIKSKIKRYIKNIFNIYNKQSYVGEIDISNSDRWQVTYFLKDFEDKESDIGLNFFIGNTERIKKMGGWNDNLKIGEHLEFFVRCKKNNIKVYYTNSLYVYHCPERYVDYNLYRERGVYFFKIMIAEHRIKRIVSLYPEKNLKQTIYLDNSGEFNSLEEKINS